ncbi:hypothetical protein TSAR_012295 [Trichomalopsis sarcophagae]|uniref:DUF4806 domain-containing protein n=1 Tax=Trichomalopsis sarcophagae TaxID=543379 RepID=A0A232FN50_9HYME|nr:hypothetical protein TSAR_012295 [Trichomalopsis sarcophagae]
MRASKTDRSKEQFRGNELSKCMETVIVGSRAEKGLPTELEDRISGLSDILRNAKNRIIPENPAFILDKRVVNVMNNQIDFNLKYGYETPFSTKEKFNQFNEELKVNKFLRNDTCYELMQHIDKNYLITRSYVSMMKRFLTKVLATQFTAMRASKTDRSKEQFRGNELSKCMETVIVGSRAEKGLPTELKDIISGLSVILCNAKKWN